MKMPRWWSNHVDAFRAGAIGFAVTAVIMGIGIVDLV